MALIDDLEAAEASEETLADQLIAYIAGVPAMIAAAAGDPTRLKALQDKLTAEAAKMQAALDAAPKP